MGRAGTFCVGPRRKSAQWAAVGRPCPSLHAAGEWALGEGCGQDTVGGQHSVAHATWARGSSCPQPECGPAAADFTLHMALGADELFQIPLFHLPVRAVGLRFQEGEPGDVAVLKEEAGVASVLHETFFSDKARFVGRFLKN